MITPFVIQIFCEEHLENVVVRGNELKASCPYCGKTNAHWGINLVTTKQGCFKCGKGGNFYSLHKHILGFYPNVDKLEEEYSSELSLEELQNIFSTVDETVQNTEIGDWTAGTCGIEVEGRIPKRAREYLLSRNISVELAKELDFRVAVSGCYQNRVIMPIKEGGVVLNFVARLLGGEGKRYTGPHRDENFVNKSKLLWGFDRIKFNSEIILVEGIFDCISLYDLNSVAILGKVLSNVQTEKLLEKAKSVIVLTDGGFVESAKKIAEKLLGLVPIKIALMEKGDPSDSPGLARDAITCAVDYYSL